MAQEILETLLFRIRDGEADSADIQRALELIATEPRLPDELREVVDFEDAEGDAVGLLAVLGADSLFGDVLREGLAEEMQPEFDAPVTAEQVDVEWAWHDAFVAAVAFEAGDVEIADMVLARLGIQVLELPLADAILNEAGSVDLVAGIESNLTDTLLPIAEAVAFEAGEIDIADAVVQAIGGAARLDIAGAVREEAGSIDVWPSIEAMVSPVWVSAMLDRELSASAHRAAVVRLHDDTAAREQMTAFASLGPDLRSAVMSEAGDAPNVWTAVASAIGVDAESVTGWDETLLANAVAAEAGSIDCVDSVLSRIEGAARLPKATVEVEAIPAPANNSFGWGQVLMMAAAALLIAIAVPQVYSAAITSGTENSSDMVVGIEGFASAGEIIVEELDYGDNSNVYQATGDDGALILWVDEGIEQ